MLNARARLKAACLLGLISLFLPVGSLHAQIVNANWSLPNSSSNPVNNDYGTSQIAEISSTNGPYNTLGFGWYMSPALNPNAGYTSPGYRDEFCSVEPIDISPNTFSPPAVATGWSFWIQAFTQSGYASQEITKTDNGYAITPGQSYTFTSLMSFQTGTGPGQGYNAVTLANQTEPNPVSPNSGDLYSYLGVTWINKHGVPLGNVNGDNVSAETTIPAGSVMLYDTAPNVFGFSSSPWAPYSVTAVAPPGTVEAVLTIGWENGGLDGNTGYQSAFADDETFIANVPEPATASLLASLATSILARRRHVGLIIRRQSAIGNAQ